GLFLSRAARLGEASRAPVWAIAIQAVWACILALSGTFDQLTAFSGFAFWLFYWVTAASGFLRRRKMSPSVRPYPSRGYPVLPGLLGMWAGWLVVNTIYTNPWRSAAGLALISLGLPLYFYFRRKRDSL